MAGRAGEGHPPLQRPTDLSDAISIARAPPAARRLHCALAGMPSPVVSCLGLVELSAGCLRPAPPRASSPGPCPTRTRPSGMPPQLPLTDYKYPTHLPHVVSNIQGRAMPAEVYIFFMRTTSIYLKENLISYERTFNV